ncbi:serine/threonine-protein kinase [Goodfellowiella coeruleoviolacea]|nr:serine/threonine-protein kinase [Goodfellowiella coeruleoviolacea]
MESLAAGDPTSIDRYRLIGRLGAGGMGRVYLALSVDGRLVAVKVINQYLAAEPRFRKRFAHEVAAARRVSGAYTAAVMDADPTADQPWLATVYVPGPSLADAVARHGPLPADSVLALAAGLAAALREIHRVGLIHRDLKPSNVLLTEDGPRVIDFGITRAAETDSKLTTTGFMVGTPGFMSPEQVEGGELTQASDVFSLGSTLYFAATGASPFGDTSAARMLYRVVHTDPDLTVLPAAVRELVGACLHRNPALRPSPEQLFDLVGPVSGDWLIPATRDLVRERADTARLLRSQAEATRQPTPGQQPVGTPDQHATRPQGGLPDFRAAAGHHPLTAMAGHTAPVPAPAAATPVPPTPKRRRATLVTGLAVAGVLALAITALVAANIRSGAANEGQQSGSTSATGQATTGSTASGPVQDGAASTVPQAFIGNWFGTIEPADKGRATYPVVVAIAEGRVSDQIGRSTRPVSGCASTYVLDSVSATKIKVTERLDAKKSGRHTCDQSASITLEVSADGTLSYVGRDTDATATLRRGRGEVPDAFVGRRTGVFEAADEDDEDIEATITITSNGIGEEIGSFRRPLGGCVASLVLTAVTDDELTVTEVDKTEQPEDGYSCVKPESTVLRLGSDGELTYESTDPERSTIFHRG